jgi:type IV pilus assembly protein PilP
LKQRRQRKRYASGFFPGISLTVMVILLAVAMFTGCSDSEKPSSASPGATKTKTQVTTQVTATVSKEAPQASYTFNFAGKRDPFAPLIVRYDKKALTGNRPPLERYNVGEFKMTGVVWGGYGYSAMLEGPDGKGYFVRVGSVIGPNKGVVRKITQETMVIEEKFKSISGETDRKEIILELRKKQEGMQ